MYYASLFTQLLSNPAKKPVEIVLLGGHVSIHTHPGEEVVLAGNQMNDENLVPFLHETGEAIRIDRHSFFSFLRQDEIVNLTIYVPEGNDVSVLIRGGEIRLSGNFGRLRARNDAGQIKADLGKLSVEGKADLSVFAGEIRLENLPAPGWKRNWHERRVRVPAGRGELMARVSLGDVRVNPAAHSAVNFLPVPCN